MAKKLKYKSTRRVDNAAADQPAKSVKTTPPASMTIMFVVVSLLFFASGFSSLVYQVVWTRTLGLIFGATTFATATVLSIFMGGLALGSFVAGRYADRIKRPLLWYGILECVIGVWALLAPLLFAAAIPLYKWVWLHTHASVVPFSLLRFVCNAAILLLPTACMGATLPILSRFVGRSLSSVGQRIGTLYAVNTLGAIVGAVLTGFWILPSIGLNATTLVGATINFALFLAVLLLCQFENKLGLVPDSGISENLQEQPIALHPAPQSIVKAVMLAFAASGAIAMIYEVCWTRALLMVIGSSTYAFTLMLGAFLTGIFLGSVVCSRFVDRAKQPLLWFAILQLALGAFTVVSLQQFNLVPFWNLYINAHVALDPDAVMVLRYLLAGSVLVPTTLCLGAIFPVVVRICTQHVDAVGRSVGSLYASNTIGAILGAFIAGFIAVPLFGTEKTLVLCALANTIMGLGLLFVSKSQYRMAKPVLIAAAVSGSAIMAVLCFTPEFFDRHVLLLAQSARRTVAFRGFAFNSYQEWRDSLKEQSDVRFWADGACSHVGILRHKRSGVISLVTNGHIDASDDADIPVQALISGLPLLIDKHLRDIAVVGWGSGQSVGTAKVFPQVRLIDAVELEPNVIPASKFFHHVNHVPEKDPRVNVIINDGRNYLLATDKQYDLIVSEPSNPWQAGVCNLFTREYFEICKSRLKPNGVLSLWLQIAEVPPNNLCGVIGSLNKTFPYTMAFYARPGNTVILASNSPIKIDVPAVTSALKDPVVAAEMRSVGVTDLASFLAHIGTSAEGLRGLISASNLNTDDTNHLEFDVGKSYEDRVYTKENRRMLSALSGSPWQENINYGAMDKLTKAQLLAQVSQAVTPLGGHELALGWLQESLRLAPTALGCKLNGAALAKARRYDSALQQFNESLRLDPTDGQTLALRGSLLVSLGQQDEGMQDLSAAMKLKNGKELAECVMKGAAKSLATGSSPL